VRRRCRPTPVGQAAHAGARFSQDWLGRGPTRDQRARELLERELLRALGLLERLLLALGLLEDLLVVERLLLALGLLEDLLAVERLLLALGLLEDLVAVERLLLALGLLEDLVAVERELPDLALARLPEPEVFELEDFDLLEVLVSPFSARSLFTVRAAISSARPFWPRFS